MSQLPETGMHGMLEQLPTIKVVAFIGKMGSGKTTAAKHLVDKHGYTRLRFADKLKRMLRVLGLSDEEVDGDLKSKPCALLGGKTPRHAMITLGTEWGRDMIDPNLWCNALSRELHAQLVLGHTNKFVIDDLRFLSEARWVSSLNVRSDYPIDARMIRILRSDVEGVVHQSETEQDEIVEDWMIANERTVKDLYNKLDDTLEKLYKE